MIIGAASKSHFNLVSPTVSKVHAAIVQTDGGVYIRDLASRTHVLVNGKQTAETLLTDGDYVAIGAFTFLFRNRGGKSLSVPKAAPDASVSVDGERIPIPIEGRSILIGRRAGCDIHLVEAAVSNCHALIFEQNGAHWIRDLHSRTGTFVNDRQIHQVQIEFDDDIRIGDTQMRYVAAVSASAHIDELEDLVGTAKLASDDSVHRQLEPLETEDFEPEPVKANPSRLVAAAANSPAAAPPARIERPAEPEEYDLAPSAPVSMPPRTTRIQPAAAVPIPLEPSEPELPQHFASEAELDGGSLEPLPAEAELEPADVSDDDIPLAIPVGDAEPPLEVSHLACATDELVPEPSDIAVPEGADVSGTVAFDASHVSDESFSPTISSTGDFAAPVEGESLLPIELEPQSAEVDFDDLIADELHPEAASDSFDPDAIAAAASEVHSPLAEPPAEHLAHVETPAETEAAPHEALEFAPPSEEVHFDDLIAADLHPEAASEFAAFPIEIESPGDVAEPVTDAPAESSAHADAPLEVESDSHAPLEVAASSAEVDFDHLIADDLHLETASESVASPLELESPGEAAELVAEAPAEFSAHVEVPLETEAGAHASLEVAASSAEVDFDNLIADDLHLETAFESVASPLELESPGEAAELVAEGPAESSAHAEVPLEAEADAHAPLEVAAPSAEANAEGQIADEIHLETARESAASPIELESPGEAAEPQAEAPAESSAHVEAPLETEADSHTPFEIAVPSAEVGSEDLVVGLHSEAASESAASPIELEAPDEVAELAVEAPADSSAQAEVPLEAEADSHAPLEIAVPSAEVNSDGLIADESHPEPESESAASPLGLEAPGDAPELVAEAPFESSEHVEVPLETEADSHAPLEVAASSAEVDAESLIADEVHSDAASESAASPLGLGAPGEAAELVVEAPSESSAHVGVPLETESDSHAPLEVAASSAEVDFDDLIAADLHPEAASESVDSDVNVAASSDVHESLAEEQAERATHAEIPAASEAESRDTLELAPPPNEVHFDDSIAADLHPEAVSESAAAPIELDASHDTAEPLPQEPVESSAHAGIAGVDPAAETEAESDEAVQPASLTAEAYSDDLVAGEVHPAAELEFAVSSVELESSHQAPEPADQEPAESSTRVDLAPEAETESDAVEPAASSAEAYSDDLVAAAHPQPDSASTDASVELEASHQAPELAVQEPAAQEIPGPAMEGPAGTSADVALPADAAGEGSAEENLETAFQSQPADAAFDDLIAAELHPGAPSEATESPIEAANVEAGASDEGVSEQVVGDAVAAEEELDLGHLAEVDAQPIDTDFDALIAEELHSETSAEERTLAAPTAIEPPPAVIDQTAPVEALDKEEPALLEPERDLFAAEEDHAVPTEAPAADVVGPPQEHEDSIPAARAEAFGPSGEFSIFDERSGPETAPPASRGTSGASTWSDTALGDEETVPDSENKLEEAELLETEPADAAAVAPLNEHSLSAATDAHSSSNGESPTAHPPADQTLVAPNNSDAPAAPPPIASPKPSFRDRFRALLGQKKPADATTPTDNSADPSSPTLASQTDSREAAIDVALPDRDATPASISAPHLLAASETAGAGPQSGEVIEPTDPTPESAQTLAAELPLAADSAGPSEVIESAAMTDSVFARAVDEFADQGPAPIVETAQPISDAEAEEILSGHPDAAGVPTVMTPDAPAAGAQADSLPHDNGSSSLPPVGDAAAVVKPTVVTKSADAAAFVKTIGPKRTGGRFGFWPFGRKRAGDAAPAMPSALASDANELESGVDMTPSAPFISVTRSNDDLTPADASTTHSESISANSDVGDFLEVIAPADMLDSSASHAEPNDSESEELEPINIELSEDASWNRPQGIDGLELEPHADNAAAVAISESSPVEMELDDLVQQELPVDEVISDYPADAPDLELSASAPLAQSDEPVLHVAAPALEFPPQTAYEYESSETLYPAVDLDAELTTHLAAAPMEELALSEPAPVVVESSASTFHSAEEPALSVSGTPPVVIEAAPGAFHSTEEIPLSTPADGSGPSEADSLLQARLAEVAQPTPLEHQAVPAAIEPDASAFHAHEEIPLSVPPVTGTEEGFAPAGQVSVALPPVDEMIFAALPAEKIEFASESVTSAEIVAEHSVVEPFALNDETDSGGAPSLGAKTVIDTLSSDDLPFLDLVATDAPALAVNEADLASVAAATREILADATPPPAPRPPKPVLPTPIVDDFELPPPPVDEEFAAQIALSAPTAAPAEPEFTALSDDSLLLASTEELPSSDLALGDLPADTWGTAPAGLSEDSLSLGDAFAREAPDDSLTLLPRPSQEESIFDQPRDDADFSLHAPDPASGPAEPVVAHVPIAADLPPENFDLAQTPPPAPVHLEPTCVTDALPEALEPPPEPSGDAAMLFEPSAGGDSPPDAPQAAAKPSAEESVLFEPPVVDIAAAAPLPPSAPGAVVDPFFGMGRDLGTFLGGMPLDLSRPAPPMTSLFAPPQLAVNPLVAAPEVAADIVVALPGDGDVANVNDESEESLGYHLSKMNADEPPQELFEATPDFLDALPDSMGHISDVVEVLGEHPHRPAHEPPAADPVPPEQSPQQLFSISDSGATPPSETAPRKPATHMPPRPRMGNRSLSASPFAFGSQPGADVAIPPFGGGSLASGQITTQFDGLTIPRPREVEVFGQAKAKGETFVPPSDPGRRGASMLTTLAASPPDAPAARVRSDAEIPRRPRGVGVPPLDRRGPLPPDSTPPAPAAAAAAPRRSGPSPQFDGLPPVPPPAPTNLHLRIVLPIILALALATAAGIWFFYHVSGTAEGRLRFNNLENLLPSDKRGFELAEQQLLRNADLRQFARQLFTSQNPGKEEGFLSTGSSAPAQVADNRTYDNLVSGAAFAPNTNQFVLTVNGRDPQTDARRLAALIGALYRENQRLADDSASARLAYLKSRDAVEAITAEINRLAPALQEEQFAGAELDSAQQTLAQNKAKSAALRQAWNDAAQKLHLAQAEVDRLDVAVPAPGSADAGAPAHAVNADADPQVKELSTQLAAATQSLTETRVTHSTAADKANKALDQALADFRSRIDQAQGSLKDGSQLSAYLIAAQQAQDTIRQLNADLVERQKAEQQRLADLRRVLAEKQETRLKAVWAADTQLQEMEQDLSVAEHRYNAAVGSGLDADAAALKSEAESIKNKMDARRDLIGTGDIYADEVKSMQQFIDDNLKEMEKERVQTDSRMGEMLKALSAAAPQVEKLPADQQALEESLKKQLDEINSARQAQAQAVAAADPQADAAARKLEGSITELQAKIDARRKQLAEDSHKQLTAQQAQDRAAALEKAKAALTAAQMEEADALASVRTNTEQTDAAYSAVEGLRAKAANLTADTARLSELQAQLPDQKSKSEALLAAWQRIPVPEAPGPDSASATLVDDPRLQWILLSMLGYAMLTAGMLAAWGVSHRRHHLLLTQPGEPSNADEGFALSDHADTLEPRGAAATHGSDES